MHGLVGAFWCGSWACGIHACADALRIQKRLEWMLEEAGLLEREEGSRETESNETGVATFAWPKWLPIRPITEEEAKAIRNQYDEAEFRRRLVGDRDRPH